ncbi:DUF84 family protein [Gracilibacillus oryzae]|uniref:inosine/xanthosine triphosphatase n=1 Tax=Gracilibacillus oryzae TaxID=1672701 RepID=A0A7C8GVP4_9BACI|nr:DUF84 family protein [Gracilibacillus oryzae]KAB8138327.1 DUF84 family protein [Gracilibacillus oryzae]
MKVIIGSTNKAKRQAVQTVFGAEIVKSEPVPSNIKEQPMSDEETMEGAINRAQNCHVLHPDAVCIGLEGGVTYIRNQLYLCNWGALVSPGGRVYVASGARIPLPKTIEEKINDGIELGKIMQDLTNVANIRQHSGAIGILTNHWVSRETMFVHVVRLLKGQLESEMLGFNSCTAKENKV